MMPIYGLRCFTNVGGGSLAKMESAAAGADAKRRRRGDAVKRQL